MGGFFNKNLHLMLQECNIILLHLKKKHTQIILINVSKTCLWCKSRGRIRTVFISNCCGFSFFSFFFFLWIIHVGTKGQGLETLGVLFDQTFPEDSAEPDTPLTGPNLSGHQTQIKRSNNLQCGQPELLPASLCTCVWLRNQKRQI